MNYTSAAQRTERMVSVVSSQSSCRNPPQSVGTTVELSAPRLRTLVPNAHANITFLFPDGRASSTYPKETFEEAEKTAYRIISDRLVIGFTPCDSYEPGNSVVESKIVEFEKVTFFELSKVIFFKHGNLIMSLLIPDKSP